jgi:hypothetical protein
MAATIRDKLMITLSHGLIATQRAGIALINRKALEKKSNGTYVPKEGGSGPTTHYCLSGDLRSFSAPPLPTFRALELRSQSQTVIVGSAATSHQ